MCRLIIEKRAEMTMIIDSGYAMRFFENDLDRFYDRYSELYNFSIDEPDSKIIFAKSTAAFEKGIYVDYTRLAADVVIEMHGCNTPSLREALSAAVDASKDAVYLLADAATHEKVAEVFAVEEDANPAYSHFGVFGVAQSVPDFTGSADIFRADKIRRQRLAELSQREWGLFPFLMKMSKRLDDIWVAFVGKEPAGYAVRISYHPGFCELGNMFVHPDFRGQGIAKQLVMTFCRSAFEENLRPFFGRATNEVSAHIADSAGFMKLSEPKCAHRVFI